MLVLYAIHIYVASKIYNRGKPKLISKLLLVARCMNTNHVA